MTTHPHLDVTDEAARAFIMRGMEGPVTMLNLLRFRETADYAANPELAPAAPISGRAAYDLYIEHALPHLRAAGVEVSLAGDGGRWLIGPADERWDMILLVRQKSVAAFLAWAQNESFLDGLGHRTAALADSRLLPFIEQTVTGA